MLGFAPLEVQLYHHAEYGIGMGSGSLASCGPESLLGLAQTKRHGLDPCKYGSRPCHRDGFSRTG